MSRYEIMVDVYRVNAIPEDHLYLTALVNANHKSTRAANVSIIRESWQDDRWRLHSSYLLESGLFITTQEERRGRPFNIAILSAYGVADRILHHLEKEVCPGYHYADK